jgi:hypothetical protein
MPLNIMRSFGSRATAFDIDKLLGTITIGQPIRHQALTVYPLKADHHGKAFDYLVLDDAIKTGAFRITEVSEGGTVPHLRAINETADRVFLLDGEQLVGAKQNRVLNLSLMVAPKSEAEIPVACVEAGRWRMEGGPMRAAEEVYFSHGRSQKMDQVSRSLRQSGMPSCDQAAVWDTIAAKSARMNVSSPTSAAAKIYEDRRRDVQDYRDAIAAQAGQVGAAYAIGGTLVGIEIFDNDATFRKLSGKLTASYALDAMEVNDVTEPPDANAVRSFIESVRSAPRQRSSTAGTGETVRLSTDELAGAALELEGNCVHLSAFNRHAEAGIGLER